MAQLVQKTSFAGGEIDSVLLERQNIEKVATGLETMRNTTIGKNALPERRKGTKYLRNAKANTGNVKTFSVPYSDLVLEFTTDNIRIHKADGGTYEDVALAGGTMTDAVIPYLNIVYANKFLRQYGGTYFKTTSPCVYIFGMDSGAARVLALDNTLVDPTAAIPVPLGYFVQTAYYAVATNQDLHSGSGTQSITGTANEIEIAATVVTEDGEESVSYLTWLNSTAPAQLKQPTAAGDYVELTVQTDTTNLPYVTTAPLEFRFYMRPKSAGAFGYIGSSFEMTAIANGFQSKFRYLGQAADYSKNPPTYLTSTSSFNPKCGLMYQGRLLYGNIPAINKEYIFGSKTNFPWNLSRDYPLGDDSALLFKSGQSGVAEVLHMIDMGTLVVFTSVGLYTQMTRGALTPTNAALTFVNNSVADATVPPIKFGDYLLFYDGSVKAIDFSNQRQNFTVEDITDYSSHLFKNRTLVSWATVKRENTEILWAVMDDGVVLSLTKNPKQQLEAWKRHDFFEGDAISVCGDVANEKLLFIVERDGLRTLEYLGDEYMDAYVSKSGNIAAALGTPLEDLDLFFSPMGPDGFSGDIRLNTNSPGSSFEAAFTVGNIYRMFDSVGSAYDIECTSIPGVEQVVFSIYNESYSELPVELRTNPDIYETFTVITGLDHLNGKDVALTIDGTTAASPLNDKLNLPLLSPVAGSLTVSRAAYATVGIPFASDIGTTDVKSPQDAKVGLSTRIAGKVYTKTDADTREFYVGAYFSDDDKVTEMARATEMFPNQNNRTPKIRSYETVVPADWNNGGRVCIRVVDPVPFRLLSITTAVTIS